MREAKGGHGNISANKGTQRGETVEPRLYPG